MVSTSLLGSPRGNPELIFAGTAREDITARPPRRMSSPLSPVRVYVAALTVDYIIEFSKPWFVVQVIEERDCVWVEHLSQILISIGNIKAIQGCGLPSNRILPTLFEAPVDCSGYPGLPSQKNPRTNVLDAFKANPGLSSSVRSMFPRR